MNLQQVKDFLNSVKVGDITIFLNYNLVCLYYTSGSLEVLMKNYVKT